MVNSLVSGNVTQIDNVNGSVTITSQTPPYRIEQLPVRAQRLPVAHAQEQPSRLLLPHHGVVPFAGRDQQLHSLAGWADGDGVAVRLAHAAGGQGKTRLATHFAADRAEQGWAVWRAIRTPTGEAPTSQVEMPAGGRALLVVDYADRWPVSHLVAMIIYLAAIARRAPLALRVLLLARSPRAWWPTLSSRLDSDLSIDASAVELPPLGDELDRGALFGTAADHFAMALGVDHVNGWPIPASLHEAGFAQVLAVHMAALAAADAYRHGKQPPTQPHAVSAYLLRREQAHWQQQHARADGLATPPEAIHRASYLATLTGAQPRTNAHLMLARTGLVETIPAANQILDDHRICNPPTDSGMVLEALHPDRLGEDLIALSTPGHQRTDADTAALVDDWTLSAIPALLSAENGQPPVWAPSAITVLVETASRWPHIATRLLYPLVREQPALALAAGGTTLARLAELPDADFQALEAVETLLPTNRHIDLDLATAAISTVLDRHRLATITDPTQRAYLHQRYGLRLANAGRNEEALASTQEAVSIYRRLAEAQPEAFMPNFAGSLDNLGICLFRLGRREEALDLTQEAVSIYRRLVGIDADAWLPDLASSLNNLGVLLSGLGRREQALEPAQEAVEIRRRLAETNPQVFMPDLAMSLHNLAARLFELGRREQALEPAQEAAAIYRRLAEANPQALTPDLAASLSNLGILMSELGRREQALEPAQEAVDIGCRLAKTNPTWLPELAGSLENLGLCLSRLGRPEQALPPTQEAVDIRRQLAKTNPRAWQPGLAGSLSNLGASLAELGRPEEALEPAQEAVAIYRRLVETNPQAFMPDLAGSLDNFSTRLSDLGRREQALEPAQEAVAIYRRLVESGPQVFMPDLARSLSNLGIHLAELRRREQALPPTQEAVDTYRGLAKTNPQTFMPDLARSLRAYARVCVGINHLPEALAATHEAIDLYQPLAKQLPEAFGAKLFSANHELADVLHRLGRTDESAQLHRQLFGPSGTEDATSP